MIRKIYRALTKAELVDIDNIKAFRAYRHSLECKEFALTEEDGHFFGKEIVEVIDKEPYYLIEVTISEELYQQQEEMSFDSHNGLSVDRDKLDSFNDGIISIRLIYPSLKILFKNED